MSYSPHILSIFDKIRRAFARQNNSVGLFKLKASLQILDGTHTGQVGFDDFYKTLLQFNLTLTAKDIQDLFDCFAIEGQVPFKTFIDAFVVPLNLRRREVVHQAFKKLDAMNTGRVSSQDLLSMYDAAHSPEVKSRSKTAAQVAQEFGDSLDSDFVTEGMVDLASFEKYHMYLGTSIEDDNFFIMHLWSAWNMSGAARPSTAASSRPATASSSSLLPPAPRRHPSSQTEQAPLNHTSVAVHGGRATHSQIVLGGVAPGMPKVQSAAARQMQSSRVMGSPQTPPRTPPTGRRFASTPPSQLAPFAMASLPQTAQQMHPDIAAASPTPEPQPVAALPDNPVLDGARRKLRAVLARRGIRGIFSLGRCFRLLDKDHSGTLSQAEFTQGMKTYRSGLEGNEITALYAHLDQDGDAMLNYDEFLIGIRGELNPFRRALVSRAFAVLDRDASGAIDIHDIRDMYSAGRHPDVLQGKKTEDQVLLEFLDTFDAASPDGCVTASDFLKYYSNVSASVDEDRYFETMMTKVWNLDRAGIPPSPSPQPATTTTPTTPHTPIATPCATPEPTRTVDVPALDLSSAALGVMNEPTDDKPVETNENESVAPMEQGEEKKTEAEAETSAEAMVTSTSTGDVAQHNDGRVMPRILGGIVATPLETEPLDSESLEALMERVRGTLGRRNIHLIASLSRAFRYFDQQKARVLAFPDFQKAIKAHNINLNDGELESLFSSFDPQKTGVVNYAEFMHRICGDLNARRTQLVTDAFRKMDTEQSGFADPQAMKMMYNKREHSDVKSGKRSEMEVTQEFIDNFELVDGKVTLAEFIKYYTTISCVIDDDNHFQLLLWNGWNFNRAPRRRGGRTFY